MVVTVGLVENWNPASFPAAYRVFANSLSRRGLACQRASVEGCRDDHIDIGSLRSTGLFLQMSMHGGCQLLGNSILDLVTGQVLQKMDFEQ